MKVTILEKESNNYKNIYTKFNPKFFVTIGAILILLSLIIKFVQLIIIPILVVFGFVSIGLGSVMYLLSVIKNNINLK